MMLYPLKSIGFLKYALFWAITALFSLQVQGQYIITEENRTPDSLFPYASWMYTGDHDYTVTDFIYNAKDYSFTPMSGINENIGFTKGNVWVKFEIENATEQHINYFLETGRPITDTIDLFLVDTAGNISMQQNGDAIPFNKKNLQHRKTIFEIHLQPKEKLQAYVHYNSDGEVIMLPLTLHSFESFLSETYQEQIFYGFFYGLLTLAFVVYLFFYTALKDITFFYYSFYVLFIALMQFSLDGFFHQYFTPDGGWLSNNAVLLSALMSTLFFGQYGSAFLKLKEKHTVLYKIFKATHIAMLTTIIGLVALPSYLEYFYPIANVVGLVVVLELAIAIVIFKRLKMKVDTYFIVGISGLILGFIIFILNNFNTLPNSFFSNNGPKLGIVLEITFLSISMSNRIKMLRIENIRNQALALQRERDMNAIKSSFLSNISHELRTPLNLIMGVASSIADNGKQTAKDLTEKSNLILSSSKTLLESIDDILNFTVIEKGEHTLKTKPFNIKDLLLNIGRASAQKASYKKLSFSLDLPDDLPKKIIGDRDKISQILNNLLDNAIKFTHEGTITLKVNMQKHKDGSVSLMYSITDTGIGIAPEKMSTIYESFTKKSFRDNREFDGLGLGLYIVKKFVDLKGGHVEIENNKNGGVTSRVTLTYKVVPEVSVPVVPIGKINKDKALEDCKILLVEDNKMNQIVVKLLVKKWKNASITIANNGQEALDILKEQNFNVILMDLQMPVMDGFETIAAIRGGKIGQDKTRIPIIALTADCTDNTKREVARLGANDYMTKPIDEELLYSKIFKQYLAAV